MNPKLSICISTYKRADFIGATLDTIVRQLEPCVELIVVDGASPDSTRDVVAPYVARDPSVKYFREPKNSGVDCDYDKAVSYAAGDYCWLMTDDDVLQPRALSRVLALLDEGHDLIVANSQVRSSNLSQVLNERFLSFTEDREYGAGDCERFLSDTAHCLTFIGSVIIKRSVWLMRDRSRFFGSLFVHVGVIFQHPPIAKIKVIADPLILIRYGNALWTSRAFEIWMFKWPQLIWSFDDFSDNAKNLVSTRQPWRQVRNLLQYRALDAYSLRDYHSLLAGRAPKSALLIPLIVALIPSVLANVAACIYCVLLHRKGRMAIYDLSRCGSATWISRLTARSLGI